MSSHLPLHYIGRTKEYALVRKYYQRIELVIFHVQLILTFQFSYWQESVSIQSILYILLSEVLENSG